jgi:hypothetical protein
MASGTAVPVAGLPARRRLYVSVKRRRVFNLLGLRRRWK